MKFYSASKTPRPSRLSKQTRDWAYDSLQGKYGDEAVVNTAVSMDGIEDFSKLPVIEQYDLMIREIAKSAPLRVCEAERVSGSATLGAAIWHLIPASVGGEYPIPSISHLTISFKPTLEKGLSHYRERIAERESDKSLTERQRRFLESMKNTLDSFEIWHARYLDAVKDEKPEIYEMLLQVPFSPARNFKEAVQSLWFVFAFVRLCGNWPGIGRIDELLGSYLKQDLKSGAITLDEAREVLASMFIKGCEWIQSNTPIGSGDAQHYQNIVLSGINEKGEDITNEVTHLVLDIVEELGISDFPITVRVNRKTSDKLLKKVARVMRHGGGVVAVYNEDLILELLEKVGYERRVTRNFANDGCWEVQIPGQTNFAYMPIDSLQVLNTALGIDGSREVPQCGSIEEVYALYNAEMKNKVEDLYKSRVEALARKTENGWEAALEDDPATVVSLFEEGCIESAASYHEFGPIFTVRSPHIGGAPDTGNSLYAIQKLVFEEKKVTLSGLVEILKNNWEGNDALRLHVKNHYTYFGNDFDESDKYTTRVLNDFADLVHAKRTDDCPILFIPGVSTFGRQIEWLPQRCATAFGARKGDILSGNNSPTPGTDASGATAIIKSYCKAEQVSQTNGSALDVKLFPETIRGADGISALVSLIRGFVELGGYFMQLDVMDAKVLKAAQVNPEQYKTLSVRVSGWNARFVTLDKDWQQMIIERTQTNV